MSDDTRAFIFERLMDDLELYFDYKRDLNKKVKRAYADHGVDVSEQFWQENEMLENLRERARRALDEYVASRPDSQTEVDTQQPAS